LAGWNTASVTSLQITFSSASRFNINLATWNVLRVTSMSGSFDSSMLENCYKRGISELWGTTLQSIYPQWSSLCSPCDAAAVPTNGLATPCTGSLASGSSCTPTCNSGYTVSGTRTCTEGALTTNTAACNPNPCTITAPTNGALGACPSSLASGSLCTPSCNTGYVQTAGGTYSCSLGVLSGTVMCTATPRCAPYNKRTLWPGEHVWELSGFTP
jgi:hypothetical protein